MRAIPGLWRAWAFSVGLLAPASGAGAAGGDFAGDWVGWGYEVAGGDYPLQLRVRASAAAAAPEVRIAFPHHGARDLPASEVHAGGRTLEFRQRGDSGEVWLYRAELDGDRLKGSLDLDGSQVSTFELSRAAREIAPLRPERYRDCAGVYRGAAGPGVVVTRWPWGELRLLDLGTGAMRTLFPVDDDRFFAGAAEYVPTPVAFEATFERDAEQEVAVLVLARDGVERRLARSALEEEEVQWRSGDALLSGTLVKPAGAGPFPAVVLLGGSGWQLRGDVRQDADAFAALGLAALAFDLRGRGRSTGAALASFDQLAEDAAAAALLLAERPDVDGERIGVFGRSRGGWIAPLAAAKSAEIDFAVLFVAPAVSPARQETTRRLNEVRAAGHGEAAVARAAAHLELLWRAVASDAAWPPYRADRTAVEREPWFDLVAGPALQADEDFAWMRLNMLHDPLPALEQVACPVLALFGGADPNVTPEENVEPMRAAFARGGNARATLLVIPGADHGLRCDRPGTRLHDATGYARETWPAVAEWLAEQR